KIVVEESSSVIDVAKKVSPAVVSISTKSSAVDFFGQTVTHEGGGSGFIITSDGLIVTNKHVVSDKNAMYTVFTYDWKSYPAEVLARDSVSDFAVVKIKASGLHVVELGDSDQLQVGQRVVAIGNALGQFQNTVTSGVISAKERQIDAGSAAGGGSEHLEGLLQTDAAINEGNSGGPLINLKGEVVGINTAVAAKGQAEGIGFALPMNSIKNSIAQVTKSGKIVRAYLGVRYIALTKEIADQNDYGVSTGAVLVGNPQNPAVVKGSPAAKAGLKADDVITKINGEQVTEQKSLTRILNQYNVGDVIEIVIVREKKEMTVSVTLEELK
ncbi:trypsin-like serine protease, partial [Candidatus Berkelbacteria bacterium]|nr:trypsin-like serine protease [Candidatus Berkelbacteria bacterium]